MRLECTYRAGIDNREEMLRELEKIFPRWYDREVTEASSLTDRLTIGEPVRTKSFEETVRDSLTQELTNHADDLRDAVLGRAEELLKEVSE